MRFSLLMTVALFSLGTSAAAQEVVTYSYDALGRLVATSTNGGANNGTTSAYSYDAASNRTNVTVSASGGGTPTPAPMPSCSFAVEDASGNDEFSIYVSVRRIGTCSGNVQIAYTTDYSLAPSGALTFAPQDAPKYIVIPPNCCAIGTVTYYNVSISIISGSAVISDGSAVVEVHGNG